MKFLIEHDEQYNILICKFDKNDLILRDNQILFVGKYKPDGTRLPPLQNKKFWVDKSQISQYGDYIYIPEDQLQFDSRYSWPFKLSCKIIQKYKWGEMKKTHPYLGK